MNDADSAYDRLAGVLLGTAVGDALGLPAEGLSRRRLARWYPGPLRHRFLFRRGMVSDDTEHTLMLAQSFLDAPDDPDRFARRFASRLKCWFLALPAGVGLGTARACLKMLVGFPPAKSGVRSAGNGPAMRSALLGVLFASDDAADTNRLRAWMSAATTLTHTNPRALTAALAVADMARLGAESMSGAEPPAASLFAERLSALAPNDIQWLRRVERMNTAWANGHDVPAFAEAIGQGAGVSGYAYATVPVAVYAWRRHWGDFSATVESVIRCGGDADTASLTDLQTEIESVLKDYEAAVAVTDVWERFYDNADSAVTRTRESLLKLAEDAKKLGLDVAKKQDDARFKDLLKTDWRGAADEVAQAMARVNADWIATGQRVAELQAKAEAGDIGAQRDLEKALERRKELATERGGLEGRQREVDNAERHGERRFDQVRGVMNDEARYQTKEGWDKAAEQNPVAANAALESFIADLESQLANTGALAEQARTAQDYAGASAYEEQAKSLQDQLSELRGMKGQTEERDSVTGDFSARAMEAMMRGGGGQSVDKQQLETQQSMNERLGKLVDLYAAPTVVAVD